MKFDGTNHDEVMGWLAKQGHAVRGGIHQHGPGEHPHIEFEDGSGNLHVMHPGHGASVKDGKLVIERVEE